MGLEFNKPMMLNVPRNGAKSKTSVKSKSVGK
jgi:hypothetical protein